jgi:hypothetical protein
MCIALKRPPELVALVEALTLRKGVFHLKGRLLKAANRVIEGTRQHIASKAKNLPPPLAGKEIQHPTVQARSLSTENQGKPEWQIRREEAMARLDREAELNRQREARLQMKKVFTPSVFVGRSED